MNLSRLRETWTQLGNDDPLWAVMSNPGTRGNKWDVDAFFASGRKDITEVFANLDGMGVTVSRSDALDFGCGVGRLTQALAAKFEHVIGVDIASSMIERARELSQGNTRCEFKLNTTADLKQFSDASFDFVFSHIVFQHMEPRFALGYIGEFGRLLRPNGVAVFQVLVPDGTHVLGNWMKVALPGLIARVRRLLNPGAPAIELYGIPKHYLFSTIEESRLAVIKSDHDPNGGRGTRGLMIYARRAS